MRTRILALIVGLCVCYFTVNAQEPDSFINKDKTSFTDNTYMNIQSMVGFNINSNFDLYYHGVGASLQYGKWIRPTYAVQLNANSVFSKDVNVNGVSADFLVNLSNLIKLQEDRAFTVIPFIGVSCNYLNLRIYDKYQFNPGVDLGCQFKYKISESLSLLAEARASISYEVRATQELIPISNFSTVKLGVSYKFNALKQQNNKLKMQLQDMHDELDERLKSQQIIEAEKDKIAVYNEQLEDQLQEHINKQSSQPAETIIRYEFAPIAIFFEIGKDSVTKEDIARLGYVAEILKKQPDVKFVIEGYADSFTGSEKVNQELSQKRADAVYRVLTNNYNVSKYQLEVVGKGAVNDLFDDITLNRAVVIRINK